MTSQCSHSKGLVILQTGWFVNPQCIALATRKGLPLTELSWSLLRCNSEICWCIVLVVAHPWNVQHGVRVYKKQPTEEPVIDGECLKIRRNSGCTSRCTLCTFPPRLFRGPFCRHTELAVAWPESSVWPTPTGPFTPFFLLWRSDDPSRTWSGRGQHVLNKILPSGFSSEGALNLPFGHLSNPHRPFLGHSLHWDGQSLFPSSI